MKFIRCSWNFGCEDGVVAARLLGSLWQAVLANSELEMEWWDRKAKRTVDDTNLERILESNPRTSPRGIIGWGAKGDDRLGRAEGSVEVETTRWDSAQGLVYVEYGPEAGIDEARRIAILKSWKEICPNGLLEERDASGKIVPVDPL